jgi:DNA-binding Lrp family transcriptional regulator
MAGADLVPSREAAARLGVTQQEVRRLVKAGVLRGALVANRLMVDRLSLERRARQSVSLGPRRTPRNAWTMLRMLSCAEVRFVDPVTRSKLKASLKQITPQRLHGVTGRRATTHNYRVKERYVPQILQEPGVVRTGMSAFAYDPGFDLVSSGGAVAELYCEESTHRDLSSHYGLVPGDEMSNVVIRVVEDLERVAEPPDRDLHALVPARDPRHLLAVVAAVGVDLMDNLDSRVARAGRQRVEALLNDFRTGLIR